MVAAVIEDGGRYLITQRNPGAVLPLLWEFPGGRVEDGESDIAALIREVRERIGVSVTVVEQLGHHIHEYAAYDVHLALFSCRLPSGSSPSPVGVNALRWVTSSEMDQYEFPPADQQTMSRLLGLMT